MITGEGIVPLQHAESGSFPHRFGCSQNPDEPTCSTPSETIVDQGISRLLPLADAGREWTSDGTEPEQNKVPGSPADVTHPRRALSRLALSSEAAETAELAAGHVPTVSDRYSSPYETVEYAARLVSSAREVLTRAVVHAREIGGSWEEIGEALAITASEAQERYREAIERWDDALDRPWEQSGPFLSSRMPSGCSDPDFTIHYLDEWCLKHLEPSSGSRSNATHDGIEDRMVSANLPAHTEITEWNSVLRTARHLIDIGAKPDSPEWRAYEARKAAVVARQQERSR